MSEVIAARCLEYPQTKDRQCCQEVVKDVSLDGFIVSPDLVTAEYIDFNGQAMLGRFQVKDKESHVLVDHGVVAKVGNDVCPEYTYIRLSSSVDNHGCVDIVLLVILFNFLLLRINIFS